jgi:hypothetical protein
MNANPDRQAHLLRSELRPLRVLSLGKEQGHFKAIQSSTCIQGTEQAAKNFLGGLVTGHDFSRADKANKQWALAPAEARLANLVGNQPFFRSP